MAGGIMSPRQRMINMMYLVLTAMLALNVSAEVLDAFVKIEEGLERTSEIAKIKNDQMMRDFSSVAAEYPEKAKIWHEKALLVNEKTKELKEYIQTLKIDLIKEGDGKDAGAIGADGSIQADTIQARDKTGPVNELLIGTNRNGRAYELKKRMHEYRDYIVTNIITKEEAPGLYNEISSLLTLQEPTNRKGEPKTTVTWETHTFEGMPLIAAIALMSKMQVDLINAESSLYDYLINKIGSDDFKFTNIVAVVKPVTSSAILKGADYEAQIFLGAYDPNQQFTAKLNVGSFTSDKDGKITVKRKGEGVGMQNVNGKIMFKGPKGDEALDVKFEYQVMEPNLVVSPSKMNVFYLGLENPVDISVAGVSMADIETSITNGTLRKEGNSFIVMPKELKGCEISVRAKVDGVMQNMGTRQFRVKRVPIPSPGVHGITGKNPTKGELAASQGVVALMPADFDFDLKFTVKGFTVSVVDAAGYTKDAASSNQLFTDAQRKLIGGVRSGQPVFITGIKATGPDGSTVDLPDLVMKVK